MQSLFGIVFPLLEYSAFLFGICVSLVLWNTRLVFHNLYDLPPPPPRLGSSCQQSGAWPKSFVRFSIRDVGLDYCLHGMVC